MNPTTGERRRLESQKTGEIGGLVWMPDGKSLIFNEVHGTDTHLFLLSLVEEPLDLASRMTPKDRRRLRARMELTDREHPTWRGLAPGQSDRARAAFALLIR